MEENNLPAHPLFIKGYSSVGDWHSSSPEGSETKGRDTRFGGLNKNVGYTRIIKLIIEPWSQI